MKKFIQRVQDLSQKAAQMKAAIQSVPAKTLEIREAVTAAAGQLHQLRSDVQTTVHSLRTESDDHLTQALREVDQSNDVFELAGYAVHEVEMELGLGQRLVVHMVKVQDVPHAEIRSLLSMHDSRKTTYAILAALLKAEELADHVSLNHLTYHKLTVYAGLTPSVRLCWSAENVEEVHPAAPVVTPAVPPPLPASSAFGQSSFFERSTQTPAASVSVATAPVPAPMVSATPATPTHPQESHEPATSAGDFGRSALERFKKMPDLSKYRK